MGFATDELQPMFSIGQYMDFVLVLCTTVRLYLRVAVDFYHLGIFQLNYIHVFKTETQKIYFISFIIGAVISPTPDMFSQTMIALPMILLYETSLFVLAKIDEALRYFIQEER